MAGTQKAYRPSLDPLVAKARSVFMHHVGSYANKPGTSLPLPLVLVACSGGADSLALASVAGFYQRRGDIRAGAIVLDHGLQPATAEVARKTVDTLERVGLNPVIFQKITVEGNGTNVEATARSARYRAFMDIAYKRRAAAILTGHQADDQAEQVLLGLARGSGNSSLSGISSHRVLARRGDHIYYLPNDPSGPEKPSAADDAGPDYTVDVVRPFLELTKKELEEICRLESLSYWEDPTNYEPSYLRSRIRTQILPYLSDRLDPGVSKALCRTAAINRAENDFIDGHAASAFSRLAGIEGTGDGTNVFFDAGALRLLSKAIRLRVYRAAAACLQEAASGTPGTTRVAVPLTWERSLAVDALVFNDNNGKKVQTPGILPGRCIQWLKKKGSPGAAHQKAEKFFSHDDRHGEGIGYPSPPIPARAKDLPWFGSAGKYGTLVVRIEST